MKIKTSEVEELIKNGKKVSDIAREYGVTREAIYRHIRKIKNKENNEKQKQNKKEYKYSINWRVYNEELVKRGEMLLDFDVFENWNEELSLINHDKIGAPYKYPVSFICFCIDIKILFDLDYRGLEGFVRKFFIKVFNKKDEVPDYTTFNVRFGKLQTELKVYEQQGEQELTIDSTGLKTQQSGEYRINKHRGKRKKFIKLSIAVDIKTKQIVSFSVGYEDSRDNKEFPKLKNGAEKYGKIKKIYMDSGYDDIKIYRTLAKEKIEAIIKPRKTTDLKRIDELIKEKKKKLQKEIPKWKKEELLSYIKRLKSLKKYLEDPYGWKERNGYVRDG